MQVYVSVPDSRVERAPRELKGFTKLTLAPGETQTAEITIPTSRLAYFDEAADAFVLEPATYTFHACQHAEDTNAPSASLKLGR